MRCYAVLLLVVGYAGCALAQGGGQGAKPDMTSMVVMMGAIMAIMYFMMIRPEQKRQKKREAMLAALQKNAKVVTSGGIHGTIHTLKDKTVMVKVADGVILEFARASIGSILGDDGAAQDNTRKKL